jgi:hypothetical protein
MSPLQLKANSEVRNLGSLVGRTPNYKIRSTLFGLVIEPFATLEQGLLAKNGKPIFVQFD